MKNYQVEKLVIPIALGFAGIYAISKIGSGVSFAIESIGSGVEKSLTSSGKAFESVGSGIGSGVSSIGAGVYEVGKGIGSGVADVGRGIGDIGTGTGSAIESVGQGAGIAVAGVSPTNIIKAATGQETKEPSTEKAVKSRDREESKEKISTSKAIKEEKVAETIYLNQKSDLQKKAERGQVGLLDIAKKIFNF
jgi:hypothetical protein